MSAFNNAFDDALMTAMNAVKSAERYHTIGTIMNSMNVPDYLQDNLFRLILSQQSCKQISKRPCLTAKNLAKKQIFLYRGYFRAVIQPVIADPGPGEAA